MSLSDYAIRRAEQRYIAAWRSQQLSHLSQPVFYPAPTPEIVQAILDGKFSGRGIYINEANKIYDRR